MQRVSSSKKTIHDEKLSVNKMTKGTLPRVPFARIKDEILGKKYVLSIAFVDAKISKKINKEQRGKNKPTNVLSFSLSKTEGELVICPEVVKKEAPKFEMSFGNFLGFLVIHGMLHLKGMEHSSTMEKLDEKFSRKFKFKK